MNYGKHDYLPMEKIEAQFAACAADPSMRSISAVLRIGREQISARGSLASYRWNAALFGALALLSAIVFPFVPEPWSKYLLTVAVVGGGITLVLGVGVAMVWRDARRLVPEERRLRAMIVETVEGLLAQNPARMRPPDWTEANFLRQIGASKTSPAIRAWIETGEPN